MLLHFAAQQLLQRKQPLCVNQLQQSQLEMETLLLLVTKIGMCTQHDLQEASQVFFAEAVRDTSNARALIGRNLQQRLIAAGDFGDQCIAQEANHLACEMLRALALDQETIDGA